MAWRIHILQYPNLPLLLFIVNYCWLTRVCGAWSPLILLFSFVALSSSIILFLPSVSLCIFFLLLSSPRQRLRAWMVGEGPWTCISISLNLCAHAALGFIASLLKFYTFLLLWSLKKSGNTPHSMLSSSLWVFPLPSWLASTMPEPVVHPVSSLHDAAFC